MKIENYIVESGNWKCKVSVDSKLGKKDYKVVECATLAFETIFGNGCLSYDEMDIEIFSLIDEDGKDFFVDDVDDCPDPSFGLLTKVYNIKDSKKNDDHFYMLSRDVFENASQPHHVEMALELEEEMKKTNTKEYNIIMSVLFNKKI